MKNRYSYIIKNIFSSQKFRQAWLLLSMHYRGNVTRYPKEVLELEKAFANYIGVKRLVSNGIKFASNGKPKKKYIKIVNHINSYNYHQKKICKKMKRNSDLLVKFLSSLIFLSNSSALFLSSVAIFFCSSKSSSSSICFSG